MIRAAADFRGLVHAVGYIARGTIAVDRIALRAIGQCHGRCVDDEGAGRLKRQHHQEQVSHQPLPAAAMGRRILSVGQRIAKLKSAARRGATFEARGDRR